MASNGTNQGKNLQEDIEIGAPSLYRNSEESLTISYPITSSIFPDKLVFKINGEYENFIDQSLNCALVALILPAMKSGSRLILNGLISKKLYSSCQGNIQAIVKLVLGYDPISIVLNGDFSYPEQVKPTFVATGFSGGIDSYSILKDHHFQRDQLGSGINSLVFNNVGANGSIDEQEIFEKRLHRARQGADAVGLPLMVVESNMDEFYSIYDDLHFFKTHTFRNAAVAHLLSNTVNSYLYAAARTYSEVQVEPSETIGYVDSITLPLLSSEHMSIQSEGARYSRSEKITALVDFEVVQKNLYVCVDHQDFVKNCSVCQKCVRTMLIIDYLGRLNEFAYVFDVEKYYGVKDKILLRILMKNKSFGKDIQLFIANSGRRLPLLFLIRLWALIIYNRIKSILKLVKRWSFS